VYRDREGNQIDVLTWGVRFEDLDYRIVRDDVVMPTRLRVRTVWEGIDEPDACMFATGVQRLQDGGSWSKFVTFAKTRTEQDALHAHQRIVAAIREAPVQREWSEVVWQLSSPALWAKFA
jgi:hypothetical protein